MSRLPVRNLLLLTSLAAAYQLTTKQHCFWPFGTAKAPGATKDKIKGRMHCLQYPSNDPMEDTLLLHELKQVEGYMTAIFDGHGGTQVVRRIAIQTNYLKEHFA